MKTRTIVTLSLIATFIFLQVVAWSQENTLSSSKTRRVAPAPQNRAQQQDRNRPEQPKDQKQGQGQKKNNQRVNQVLIQSPIKMDLFRATDTIMFSRRFFVQALFFMLVTLPFLSRAQSPEDVFPDFEPLQQGVILGRPTANEVTAHIVADKEAAFFISYGTDANTLDLQTPHVKLAANETAQIVMNELEPDTAYVYQLWRSVGDANDFVSSDLFDFRTQRLPDNSFTFVVQADSHLDEQSVPELYEITLANALADAPDFMVDLGDTSMTDKLPDKSYEKIQKRYLLQHSYFSLLCHSCPLYLVLGNHDGETGWDQTGKDTSLFQWSLGFRKQYFANPEPNGFYTGSDMVYPELGLRQNYYAWHWGDALFIVLDPYAYTVQKPGKDIDGWGFTLGESQYQWFAQTLEDSSAAFKFVFCHQIVGGDAQGRVGVEWVP